MNRKITILVPTRAEIEHFRTGSPDGPPIVITGVGPYKCAMATLAAVAERRPELIVLAGIAGAYPESGLKIGETVLVGAEHSADMGSFSGGSFHPKFRERYACPHIPAGLPMRIAQSNSVNSAAFPFAERTDVQIENMEGAAFFYTCLQQRVPFLEVRAISNFTDEEFSRWDIPKAVSALSDSLHQIIRIFA